jgi:hypothetical protein|tara:strand:+ start:926 stop:1183 length:258 start_codon:yes stop_codon:yes gene_type:complete
MTEPNYYNVAIGDVLITEIGKGLERLNVFNTNLKYISAADERNTIECLYEDALIITKVNKKCFIGRNVETKLSGEEGFGGLKIKI